MQSKGRKYVLSVRYDHQAGRTLPLPCNPQERAEAARAVVVQNQNKKGSGALLAHVLLGEMAYYPNMVSKASVGHDPVKEYVSGPLSLDRGNHLSDHRCSCCFVNNFCGNLAGWWCSSVGLVGITGDERP